MDVLVPFLLIVGVVAVLGVGVGILVARPIDRWTDRGEDVANEEPGADDRPQP